MTGLVAARGERGTLRTLALVTSSFAVVVAAVCFDVLADEQPLHTMTVALAALIVGAGRLWLRGRLPQVFAAVNLAIIGQPAVHAVTTLTHAGADALPHTSGWFEDFSGVILHVAVALLVVVLVASEPVGAFVLTAVLRALVMLTQTPQPLERPSPVRPHRRDEPRCLEQQLSARRCLGRRGPPASIVLAG